MRLTEQTRRLEALIQSMQDGLILEDLDGRVLYANRRIGELLGLPFEEIAGKPVQRVIDRLLAQAAEADKSRAEVDEALRGQGSRRVEIALERPREVRYLRLQVFDVTDSNGTPLGRGQILRDITQNREIDRMKSSLISTVSHELRTPLAAIKGYASTLLAEDVQWDSAAQQEFLEVISSESDRLSALVDDLLDMSRIEAGNLIVTRQPCDLEELVMRAAKRSNPSPGDRLQLKIPPDLPACFVDPQRIEAVLRNLLENAAKYVADHSPICVSASCNGGSVTVRVEDQGPGIPAEESQRIFESFYRVESGLTRSAAGAGLGLAISQGFVRAHGGEIWIETRSKGTCVAFSLPLQPGSTK
jgi:PAS domain S-box-containing protein